MPKMHQCGHAVGREQNPSQPREAGQPLASPVDLSHHFSTATSRREGSLVKDFYKYFGIPGMQNLAGGKRLSSIALDY